MMINGQIDSRKESLNLTDSPQVSASQKKESISDHEYTPYHQDRDKKMENIIQQIAQENMKLQEQNGSNEEGQKKDTPKWLAQTQSSNSEQEYKIKVNDIEDSQNGRLLSRLNTYDLRQQFFKNENQYPQHLFLMNSPIAQWGILQDNIKSQYHFLKQENEVKNQMIEDLKIYQLKMIKNNLKYKFLLKERSRCSMVHDKFSEIRPKMKINIQNFETSEKSLVDTINKNQDLLKSMMLKIAQNPLLLAYIIEQNNQYDNNLDQFLDDVNSLFYERVLVDNQYHNPIYILQAYLIDRELSRAKSPEEAFKISNLSTKTIYAFSKNINCIVYLEKILYKPLKDILAYSQQLEVNVTKLYDQFKKKPKSRRAAMNITRPTTVNSGIESEPTTFAQSMLDASKVSTSSTQSSQTASGVRKNPITQIKNFFRYFGNKKKLPEGQKRTQTIEDLGHDRSMSTFVLQTSGLLGNSAGENNTGRASLFNVPSTGRRDRKRKGNTITGNIISQNSLKDADSNSIDSDIVNYLKKNIEDLDLYVAMDVQQQVNHNLNVIFNLVKLFMNEIFSNVRNYPKEINIMCSILRRSLLRHFPLISTQEINSHIRSFVFNKWIFQDIQLINQRNIMSKKEQDTLSKNFYLINNLAQHIIRQQLFEERDFPMCQFNPMILSFKEDIDKFYEIISIAENTLIDLILDKSNLENTSFNRSGQLTFNSNSANHSNQSLHHSKVGFPSVQLTQQQVQDVTSLAFSLEDLRIISLLISKMPDKLEKFDPRNLLYKEAQKLQEKLKEVFKDNQTSRNSYYFIWEVGINQSTGYTEKLFQIDYGLTKKEKKELNQQQLNLIKIKEMLILFLLSIDSILYIMQLKRGQELTLLQIVDEYKIKQIDHIISIRQHQPKVQMDIYLEYLILLLQSLPEEQKLGEYELILKDICLTLDRKFSFLTQQILAYKQLYLQKKNLIKSVISYVKEQQETVIDKNIKQNMLFFIRSSYINIKIITTKSPTTPSSSYSSQRSQNYLSFQIIQNESITFKDTQSIARKKEDMLDEFKNGLCNEEPAICLSIKDFVSYLIYTPELACCIKDRTNLESFNQLISQYLDLLENKVTDLPFYQNMREEKRKHAFNLIEKYISRQILAECMPETNSERDIQFIFQAQKFCFMSEKHQCIERFFQEESMWKNIAFDLKELNEKDSHIDKLKIINKCWNNMVQVLMMVPGEGTGADDCLPVWIHILLHAHLDKIHTNINFIELMLRKDKMMQNETTYVFTQFQSAVEYIDNLTEEKVLSYLKSPDDIQKFQEHYKKIEPLHNESKEEMTQASKSHSLLNTPVKSGKNSPFSIN